MNKFKVIVFVLFILNFGVLRLYACDTNLFSIIAGNTKDTEFIDASTKLAVAAKNLNENAKRPEAIHLLEVLMNNWLEFSSKYVVFPPEWGKDDEKWKEKFSDLARILGEIRKHLGKDYSKAHKEIMRFSRRISKLYEKMPRNEEASLLLNLTYAIDELWLFVEKEDALAVNTFAKSLFGICERLKLAFSKEHEYKVQDIEERIKLIIKYSENKKDFASFQLNVLVNKLENDLTELDKEISESKTSEVKNQADK